MNLIYILIAVIIILAFIIFYIYYYTNLKNINKNLKQEIDVLHNKLAYINNELSFYKEQTKIYEKEILELPIVEILGKEIKKKNTYKNKRALVGDYMESTSNNTMKVLQYYGFKVDIVRSGLDVINRVKCGDKYDIIFTNNTYPGNLDGFDVLQQLREIKGFNTPIVIHTVNNDKNHFINDCKFNEFILKPVTIEKLQPILKKLLPKQKKEIEFLKNLTS